MNPRQYCNKTYCPYDYISDSDSESDWQSRSLMFDGDSNSDTDGDTYCNTYKDRQTTDRE